MSRKKQKQETSGVLKLAGNIFKTIKPGGRLKAGSQAKPSDVRHCVACGSNYSNQRIECPNVHMHQSPYSPPFGNAQHNQYLF